METAICCVKCNEELISINESYLIGGKYWHKNCMYCNICNVKIGELGEFTIVNDKIICLVDYSKLQNIEQDSTQNEKSMSKTSLELKLNTCDLTKTQSLPTTRDQRKRLRDNSADGFLKPRKTNKPRKLNTNETIKTSNSFEALSTDESEDEQSSRQTVSKVPIKKPPPVIVKMSHITSEVLKQLQTLFKHPYSMLYISQGLKISTTDKDDYNCLLNFLSDHNVERFTYNADTPSTIKFVLRGLPPEVSNEEICNALLEKAIEVKVIRQIMKTQVQPDTQQRIKIPLPIWVIGIPKKDSEVTKLKSLTGLFNLTIKVEDYKTSTAIIQCFRCQSFGHKAQHCTIIEKCVKCAKNHNSRVCNKQPDAPPKCVNCSGAHPANYRGCPKYEAAVQRRNQNQQSNHIQTVPSLNDQNFPIQTPANNSIPGFNMRRNNTSSSNEDIFGLKDFIQWFTSGTIKTYVVKIKKIICDVLEQPDTASRILTLCTGVLKLFNINHD